MIKRKIVRRTYSLYNGKKCHLVHYLAGFDDTGAEYWHADINKAHLFSTDTCHWGTYNISNDTDKYGAWACKQDVIEVTFKVND